MEGARSSSRTDTASSGAQKKAQGRGGGKGRPRAMIEAEELNVAALGPAQIVREIKRLEAEMFKRARNLEFEEAAALRDRIERLKRSELGLSDVLAS